MQRIGLPADRALGIGIHLDNEPLFRDFKHCAVAARDCCGPSPVPFSTLRCGFRRSELRSVHGGAQRADSEANRVIGRFRTVVSIETGDQGDNVVITQTGVPDPVRVRGCVAHADFEIGLGTNFGAHSGLDAEQVREAQSFDLGGPDFVGTAVALQFDRLEAAIAESDHRAMNADRAHTQKPQETGVGLEAHQRRPFGMGFSRSAGVVPRAPAIWKMFSSETLRCARSTELI